MKPDDEVCLCFHVTQRKLLNFVRVERPRRSSQLSECQGAGTGCGWCRPYLERLFVQQQNPAQESTELPDAQSYADGRAGYLREGKGKPPG